jgi:large subunit ribosomal protein L17
MHRHGYKGRKFGRETDQRRALIKGLAESLVRDESIKTTLPKAKELVPYIEKLITKAKKGDLHSRRQVISGLQTIESAHKLVDDLAPKMGGRTSGHVRIEKLENRRGDNAEIAKVTFVDDLKEAPVAKPVKKAESKTEVKPVVAKKAAVKKPAVKKATEAKETK